MDTWDSVLNSPGIITPAELVLVVAIFQMAVICWLVSLALRSRSRR